MTDEDIEKIIKRHMSLQMNLAGIRADFEQASRKHFVGLTDEEVLSEAKRFALGLAFPFNGITTPEMFARAIEAKLREKNGGAA